MVNLPDANSALFNYIDSLLLDDAALAEGRGAGSAPGDNLVRDDGGAVDSADAASGTDILRVLFVDVAGIPLAIPMANVPPMVDVERATLKQGVSAEGWNIGLLSRGGYEIGVLDIKDIIFPNGASAQARGSNSKYIHILLLENTGCGLGCDEVGTIVTLKRQDIEWCSHRKTRPWLSGMVKGYNRALLDVKEIVRMCAPKLNDAIRNNSVN